MCVVSEKAANTLLRLRSLLVAGGVLGVSRFDTRRARVASTLSTIPPLPGTPLGLTPLRTSCVRRSRDGQNEPYAL